MNVIDEAKRVLRVEAQSILDLAERIDENFSRAVELLYHCKGKGRPHGHGEIRTGGQKDRLHLCQHRNPCLLPSPRRGGEWRFWDVGQRGCGHCHLQQRRDARAFRGSPSHQTVWKSIDRPHRKCELNAGQGRRCLPRYPCEGRGMPLGLAPTASTTATLAMGDALAIALMEKRGFEKEDFALLHPGGTLGKRLLLKVEDLMHVGKAFPMVTEKALMKDAIFEITSKRLGVTASLQWRRASGRCDHGWRSETGLREIQRSLSTGGHRGDDSETQSGSKRMPWLPRPCRGWRNIRSPPFSSSTMPEIKCRWGSSIFMIS